MLNATPSILHNSIHVDSKIIKYLPTDGPYKQLNANLTKNTGMYAYDESCS